MMQNSVDGEYDSTPSRGGTGALKGHEAIVEEAVVEEAVEPPPGPPEPPPGPPPELDSTDPL